MSAALHACPEVSHTKRSHESVFVLAVMFVAVLGPSGWILSDLDNYKGRE
uniref:Uncharacterized protein n=1 Tax=Poecilia mexicana TaxID=48701 RepID=A0A3B3YRJ3_9TELE